MKKFMKHILVFAIVFATLSSNATENTSLTNEEDGKTTLVLKNVLQGEELIVKDAFGIILYKESILKSGDYNKSFDLTSLPDGNYIFELDKLNQVKIYPFAVKLNTVTFDKDNLSVINKPKVTAKDNVILVTASSIEKTDYTVEIFYNISENSFEKIHTETIENATSFGKKFKLLKDKKQDYQVVVTLNGRKFTTTINF
ncbi:hypothetical protein [Olleya sp. R77988]|uniref:hypothetical protein n=1 Tax=Olleya sp. R77988 TaxID=3093875 RepID=UPI0037C619CE